ncbi:MAG: hypothetical protein C5B49_10800, partial [Bdellovibrio sp.]
MRKQIAKPMALLFGLSLVAPCAPAATALKFRPRYEEHQHVKELKDEERERVRASRTKEVQVALDKLAVGSSKLARMVVTRLRATGMKNVTISPLSLQVALAMAVQAAKGDSAQELMLALGVDNMTPEEIALASSAKIAEIVKMNQEQIDFFTRIGEPEKATVFKLYNGFYGNSKAVQEFKLALQEQLKRDFGAEVKIAAFTDDTVKEINTRVSETTQGKIERLIEKLDDNSVAVLLNTVYLLASWKKQFEVWNTNEKGEFHRESGQGSKEMPMMKGIFTVPYAITEDEKTEALSLPVIDNRLRADFVLPAEGRNLDSLSDLEPAQLASALDGAQSVSVNLTLPRFGVKLTPTNLVDIYRAAGIRLPFGLVQSDDGTVQVPDFSKLAVLKGDENAFLKIDKIIH